MQFKVQLESADLIGTVVSTLKQRGIAVLYVSRDVGSSDFILETEDLTEEQKQTIIETVKEVVVSHRLKNVEQYDMDQIRNLTRAEIEAYIEAKVTDFASAKTFLKKLAIFTLYLYKRLMEA